MKKSIKTFSLNPAFITLVIVLVSLLLGLRFFISEGESVGFGSEAKAPTIAKMPKIQNVTQTVTLGPGWNAFSLYVFPDWYASNVCSTSRANVRVARWLVSENKFEEYWCDNSTGTPNFRITPNVGYFVMSTGPGVMYPSGPVIPYFTDISEGFNLIGLSTIPGAPATASYLCGPYAGTNLEITQVMQYINGGWSGHLCPPLPTFNNFTLDVGKAYFVFAKPLGSNTLETRGIEVKMPALPE